MFPVLCRETNTELDSKGREVTHFPSFAVADSLDYVNYTTSNTILRLRYRFATACITFPVLTDPISSFEPVDVTQEAIDYAQAIESNLDRLLQVKESKEEIMIPCGEQCDEPYGCWYKDYCRGLWNNN